MEYYTQFFRYAGDPSLTDFTALTETTTGDELIMVMRLMREMRDDKQLIAGGAEFRDVTVTLPHPDLGGQTALVAYCFDRSRLDVRDVGTGSRVEQVLPNYEEQATLALEHDRWFVSSIRNRESTC